MEFTVMFLTMIRQGVFTKASRQGVLTAESFKDAASAAFKNTKLSPVPPFVAVKDADGNKKVFSLSGQEVVRFSIGGQSVDNKVKDVLCVFKQWFEVLDEESGLNKNREVRCTERVRGTVEELKENGSCCPIHVLRRLELKALREEKVQVQG